MENMENSNPLATESFSYSWLVDKKPHSSDMYIEKTQSFDFDTPFTSSSHLSLVHADEIFSDGHIMPIYVDRSSLKDATFDPESPESPVSPVSPHLLGHHQIASKKKRHFVTRMWQKCFRLVKLKQLCRTMGCSRKSSRVADLERKVCEASPRPSSGGDLSYGLKRVGSLNCSSQASTRVSPARGSNGWCVDESSIHEAILYCKRSIEI